MLKLRFITLLVAAGFLVTKGNDEAQTEVPCTTDKSSCIANGFSTLTIFNNEYYCCSGGYNMKWDDDDQCSCVQSGSVSVTSCDEGEEACKNASSRYTDLQNKTLCCQKGYYMQSFLGNVNEDVVSSCTCSKFVEDDENGGMFTENKLTITNLQTKSNGSLSDIVQKIKHFEEKVKDALDEIDG